MHILHLNQKNQILFQYLRDKKKKEVGSEKGGGGEGENSPISPPLDPRLLRKGSHPSLYPAFLLEVFQMASFLLFSTH